MKSENHDPCPVVLDRQKVYNDYREVINRPVICVKAKGHGGDHHDGREWTWGDQWGVTP